MKGQFMMISSVVVGIIILSVAQTISNSGLEQPENQDISYKLEMIKEEVQKLNKSDPKERKNFRRTVDMIESYSTETSYYPQKDCFNVTLRSFRSRYSLECIG